MTYLYTIPILTFVVDLKGRRFMHQIAKSKHFQRTARARRGLETRWCLSVEMSWQTAFHCEVETLELLVNDHLAASEQCLREPLLVGYHSYPNNIDFHETVKLTRHDFQLRPPDYSTSTSETGLVSISSSQYFVAITSGSCMLCQRKPFTDYRSQCRYTPSLSAVY